MLRVMRDVIPEVVGKFIERGDLDFHPQREVISWTENMTATRKKIRLAALNRRPQQEGHSKQQDFSVRIVGASGDLRIV